MKLLVGLGNPGPQYAHTRHNVGFMLVGYIAEKYGFPGFTGKFKGLASKGRIDGQDVVLLLPQTYMNLSGASVQSAAAFYKIDVSDILVAHDELDIPLGVVKWKVGGGDAGHNGLKSITGLMGANYGRLRFGIDRPAHKAQVSDYVLHAFDTEEWPVVEKKIVALAENLGGILSNPTPTLAKIGNS